MISADFWSSPNSILSQRTFEVLINLDIPSLVRWFNDHGVGPFICYYLMVWSTSLYVAFVCILCGVHTFQKYRTQFVYNVQSNIVLHEGEMYTLMHSNISCTISVGVKGEASCSYCDSRCKFPTRACTCIVGQVKQGQYALHLHIESVLILALSIGYS